MGFFKRFLSPQDKTNSTNSSAAATLAGTPACSIHEVALTPSDKYYNDPMRVGKKPDTLGYFFDPMSGRGSYSKGLDATNTGA